MDKQKGIALFQVLLITTILLILASFISRKANNQVDSAININDKQLAMLDVKSTLSHIKFNLLSKTSDFLADNQGWNFHGEEFEISGVTVSVQDHNGLLFINKKTSINRLNAIIEVIEKLTNQPFDVSAQVLRQWFSNPKNSRIQNLEQLINLGVSYESATIIWSNITVNPRILFNPMNTPYILLPVFFDNNQIQELTQLRTNNLTYKQTKQVVEQITAIENDEFSGYITGPYYRIKISANIGESYWKMLYELSIVQEYNGFDLITLSQRPL